MTNQKLQTKDSTSVMDFRSYIQEEEVSDMELTNFLAIVSVHMMDDLDSDRDEGCLSFSSIERYMVSATTHAVEVLIEYYRRMDQHDRCKALVIAAQEVLAIHEAE